MINKISGCLADLKEESAIIELNGLGYQVLIPPFLQESLFQQIGRQITLYTYHYLQNTGGMANLLPILIGFSEEMERDFFGELIAVLGPKTAVKALSLPVNAIAKAIEENNEALLKTLPGIGKRKAVEIIARLKGKVSRFAFVSAEGQLPLLVKDTFEDAKSILSQLGYNRSESEKMLGKVTAEELKTYSAEEIIGLIYKRR